MKKRRSQPKRQSSQKRKQNRFRLFVVLSVVNILLLVLTILLLPAALQKPTTEDKPSALGIRSITVLGNTQYDNEAIIGVTGIKVGQSVFSVNKGQAAKRLKKEFVYVRDVDIDISFKREVTIRITEAEEMGAVYAGGGWVVVDENGVGLQKIPIESERPLRRMYLKGAGTLTDQVGKQVLNERSLSIIGEICTAFELYELGYVSEIDMTNLNDIRVNWKNQIDIALGNDSNLTYEIAVAATSIPKILARHGETATGLLNVSQYSDATVETPTIIFTPSSLLEQDAQKDAEEPVDDDPETNN
ncbi:MAG: FtsQ-type POTRA domain-containing protein [Clostridia bacterium]|nr:FtsQ-type POTRA domain-containing protein [Clostridia bacterium]